MNVPASAHIDIYILETKEREKTMSNTVVRLKKSENIHVCPWYEIDFSQKEKNKQIFPFMHAIYRYIEFRLLSDN